jgi:hypothetical protein
MTESSAHQPIRRQDKEPIRKQDTKRNNNRLHRYKVGLYAAADRGVCATTVVAAAAAAAAAAAIESSQKNIAKTNNN